MSSQIHRSRYRSTMQATVAAEKVGRIGFGLEYEPAYVDVAIKRWQRLTKLEATLAGDGRSFEEMAPRVQPGGTPLRGEEARGDQTAAIRRAAMTDRKRSERLDYVGQRRRNLGRAKAAIQRGGPRAADRSPHS